MNAGFSLPDWSAPLDVEPYLRGVPAQGTVKGVFFRTVMEAARMRAGRDRYLVFQDYPMRDYLELLIEASRVRHGALPLREALRRFGAIGYTALESTTVGKIIFSVAGGQFARALRIAPKAYGISLQPGTVRVHERGERRVVVEIRGLWVFPDAYQVGLFEGAMRIFGESGTVLVRTLSPCDVDLEVTW
jgi:uncharacterized protein (TIGR02265 family)